MAFFDPEDPEATLDWKTIVSRDEVGGVADHWHVFAGGYHYLVFSQPSADSAYAVKVDRDLNRMAMEHIIDRYEVPASERPPMGGEFLVTNDMFLVPEEDGIAAAFFLPTIGHKVFRMDEDLEVFDTVTIGGERSFMVTARARFKHKMDSMYWPRTRSCTSSKAA